MFEIFGFIIPLIVILVIVGIFLSFVPLGLWISAVSAGVRVNIFSLVGMRLRRVRADKIIRPLIKAQKAGMDVNANQLESHLLSGGRVDNVVDALIAAHRANLDLSFERAAAIDLAGRNVFEAVKMSVTPKIIETPWISAVAIDGIEVKDDLIDPEVMGDMVSARIPKKLRVAPFAKVDDTLAGVPGDTITVPAYAYIGDADIVAEGEAVTIEKMTTSTRKATVKKAMKGIGLTDEAVLSGYGNPVGEANTQLAMAIAAKIDNDCMDVLQTATLTYDGSAGIISYAGVVDAVDALQEEQATEKVIFVHPKQVTQLRKDAEFTSTDKYPANVRMSGEIGSIAGCRVVPSKKVPLVEVGSGKTKCYACPIIKLEADHDNEDEVPALTIYRKRAVNVETERKPKIRTTEITADEFYVAVLSNEAKVVLAKFKA